MQCNSNAPAQELPKRVSGMGPRVGRLNVGAGSLNQPVIIIPLRGIDRKRKRRGVRSSGRCGGLAGPAMALGVPVGEREICPAVVIGSGQIPPFQILQSIQKVTVVDTVRMFVQENKDTGRVFEIG